LDAILEENSAQQTSDINSERFLQTLEEEVKKALEQNYTLGVCMLSLDSAPQSTDGYSPIFSELSWVIGNDAGVVDLLIPYTYMNLAVILRKTMPTDVADSARKICAAIAARHFEVNGAKLQTTASIGAATFPHNGSNPGEIIDKARAALDRAIADGGNRVVIAD
jgi:diguanylate cyclase (GGDEF)-like protein